MRILGLDPGLRITGYACVNAAGPGEPALIEAGVIRLRAGTSVADRLVELERDFAEILERLRPEEICVEKLFAHYKRPTTAVAMAHARGVALLAARRSGARVTELAATEVKKSLTGAGHASKEQMQRAVQGALRLAELPSPPDVADAIAIALCAARRAFVAAL